MSSTEFASQPVSDGEPHPVYPTGEMVALVFDSLNNHLGQHITATRLYEDVYDRQYDPSDPLAQRSRIYIQLAFHNGHSFAKHMKDLCLEGSRFVQAGTIHTVRRANGDTPNVRDAYMQVPQMDSALTGRPRRIYRMHEASECRPLLHTGNEMREGALISWEPAMGPELEYLPRAQSKPKQSLRKRNSNGLVQLGTDIIKKSSSNSERKEDRSYPWRDSFVQAVRDAVALKVEEGLMLRGEIPAKTLQRMTVSTIIGTSTNRERLYKAGLLPRRKLSVGAPLTATELVIAEMFNAHKDILGQKTPSQKLAKQIIQSEVEADLENSPS